MAKHSKWHVRLQGFCWECAPSRWDKRSGISVGAYTLDIAGNRFTKALIITISFIRAIWSSCNASLLSLRPPHTGHTDMSMISANSCKSFILSGSSSIQTNCLKTLANVIFAVHKITLGDTSLMYEGTLHAMHARWLVARSVSRLVGRLVAGWLVGMIMIAVWRNSRTELE